MRSRSARVSDACSRAIWLCRTAGPSCWWNSDGTWRTCFSIRTAVSGIQTLGRVAADLPPAQVAAPGPDWLSLVPVLVLGTFLLLLIDRESFRRGCLTALRKLGQIVPLAVVRSAGLDVAVAVGAEVLRQRFLRGADRLRGEAADLHRLPAAAVPFVPRPAHVGHVGDHVPGRQLGAQLAAGTLPGPVDHGAIDARLARVADPRVRRGLPLDHGLVPLFC